jgi:hypothetical protein
MAAPNPLIDQVRNLWTKEVQFTTETKPESIYMVSRFLSLAPDGFLAALDLNSTVKAPTWAALPFLFYTVPKQPAPYFPYPKANKTKLTDKRQLALNRVCRKFCVKPFHGLQIMALLEQQGVKLEYN